MTAEKLKAILTRLPSAQHAEAQRRIMFAEKYGWHSIDLFDSSNPNVGDLCGCKSDDTFDFLPWCEKEE